MPIVLNCREVGYNVQNAIYVGRPSDFGNPFKAGVHGTRNEVIQKFKALVLNRPDMIDLIKTKLKGKDLICWCSPLPCHADVLLEIANEE